MTKTKRRTCADRARYQELRALRRWRDAVLAADNDGLKRRKIAERYEVQHTSFSYGWTSFGTLILRDGFEITTSSLRRCGRGIENDAALQLYRELASRVRCHA